MLEMQASPLSSYDVTVDNIMTSNYKFNKIKKIGIIRTKHRPERIVTQPRDMMLLFFLETIMYQHFKHPRLCKKSLVTLLRVFCICSVRYYSIFVNSSINWFANKLGFFTTRKLFFPNI